VWNCMVSDTATGDRLKDLKIIRETF